MLLHLARAWLSWDGSKLVVDKTIGAGNPITEGKTPLLTMDVWEHAYYLDQKNKRADYIVDFLDSLGNWDFVNANFASVASASGGSGGQPEVKNFMDLLKLWFGK